MSGEEPKDVQGSAHLVLSGVTLSATARFQMRFSVQHLMAAAQFSRRVGEIECDNAGQPFGPFFDEILWHATACVFCCVASLEAYANEFFIDREQHFPDLRQEVANKFWELFEQKPLLEKFDLALLLKNQPSLDRGSRPTQDVHALVSLRNALTHFKPEWEEEQVVHDRVSRLLQNRFPPSVFLTGDRTLFPRLWASHGCMSWAIHTCLEYAQAFEAAAGIPPKFAKFMSRLTP